MSIYLIDFKNNTTAEQVTDYLQSAGATILKEYNAFERLYLVESPTYPSDSLIVEHIIHDDAYEIELLNTTIYPNKNVGKIVTDGSIPMITITNEDKNWWKLYSVRDPDLDAPEHITNRRGNTTVVYVLDSGIETTHPEFVNADVQNIFSFNGDFTDRKGHGTAIASVIVGETCGLTNASVKSVKIFDPGMPTKQSDMLAALDAIFIDYQTSNKEYHVVNASWIISKNIYIESKIRQLMSHGIFFVAAAGNNGMSIEDVTPASMPELITVGAYNNELKPCDFSNYTGTSGISFTQGMTNYGGLDGWAPGNDIWAAGLNGTYHNVAGTSIAAAIHSGSLAYNLSIGIDEPIMNMNQYEYYMAHSFGKSNILYFDDPKYANSNNKITVYYDTTGKFGGIQPYAGAMMKVTSGGRIMHQIFNPYEILKLEVFGELPNGVHIAENGIIYGSAPTISTKYELYFSVPAKVTFTDGVEELVSLTMYVIGDAFDPAADLSGDPNLDLLLTVTYNCFANISPFCINGSVDVCTNGQCTGTYLCRTADAECQAASGKTFVDCGCQQQ